MAKSKQRKKTKHTKKRTTNKKVSNIYSITNCDIIELKCNPEIKYYEDRACRLNDEQRKEMLFYMDFINSTISYNAYLLKIQKPKIVLTIPQTQLDDSVAWITNGQNYIFINYNLIIEYFRLNDLNSILHILSHECRHLWQDLYNPSILSNYNTDKQLTFSDYINHPAEIDANAWGLIISRTMYQEDSMFIMSYDTDYKEKINIQANIMGINLFLELLTMNSDFNNK